MLVLQAFCLSISFGYFIYDIIGVYLIEHDWTNTWHHFASLAAFYVGIFHRHSGSEIAWSLFVMELTNPLLHASAYFKVHLFSLPFLTSSAKAMSTENMKQQDVDSITLTRLIVSPRLF